MIRSFRHKGLAEIWATGRTRKVDAKLHGRILRRLEDLEQAEQPEDLKLPGFDFHALRGHQPTRYTVHVNGPWRITFEFDRGDAWRVDLEQYH